MEARPAGQWLALLVAAALTACTAGPDYELPEIPVPDTWHEKAIEGLGDGNAILQTWWLELNDPTLTSFIERAGAANLDLREAVTRINQARARLGISAGQRLPTVEVGAYGSRSELSDNGALREVAPVGGFEPNTFLNIGFDASWEIDLAGRIRRSIESSQAAYEASIEDYRDVLVSLYAEIGWNYVGVRETQARISLAEANVAAQRATFELTRDRYEAGATSGLDVAQAESNLRNTEAQIPSLRIQLHAYLNRLAVLLGEQPGALNEELSGEVALPLPPSDLTVSIPAEVMRQRPDIRRNERILAAQTARIGVAVADLYPRLSLSGFFAVSAGDLGGLFDGGGTTWGISMPIRFAVFDRDRIRSAIDLEKARTEEALVRYEISILQAFEDVENSMISYSLERTRRDGLSAAAAATARAVELVKVQYREGLADFQNVLDMERSLTEQQDQLAVAEGRILKDLIGLYKALGGGWDPALDVPTVEPTESSSESEPEP